MRLPRFSNAVRVTAALEDVVVNPSSLPFGSPYSSSELNRIVFEDVVGKGIAPPISRAQAMRIPAVARGRNLMVSTICRFPLMGMDETGVLATQPEWMYSTAGPTPPQLRLAWQVDDLIFYGWTLQSRDPLGFPGDRIDRRRWSFDGDGHVLVDGVIQRSDQIVLTPGLHEGILEFGMDAISDAKALYRNVRQRLKNPSPQLNLHQTSGAEMDDDAIDALIARWAKAREGENGGVGFTNASLEIEELGGDADAALMIDARNAAALDMARIIGISGSKIDATTPKASLNYETTTGRNEEFIDTDVALYMTPIAARYSMDDVMPKGQHAAFDMGDFISLTPSPTGPGLED